MRTYESFFNTTSMNTHHAPYSKKPKQNKRKQKKEEESLEAIFELYFMPVEKSKWTTTAIVIWSMCLGALIVYLVSYL